MVTLEKYLFAHSTMRYNWALLQKGQIPLRPNGTHYARAPFNRHYCSSIFIWHDGALPWRDRTVVIDPCWRIATQCHKAIIILKEMGICLYDIGYYFTTHIHWSLIRRVVERLFKRSL